MNSAATVRLGRMVGELKGMRTQIPIGSSLGDCLYMHAPGTDHIKSDAYDLEFVNLPEFLAVEARGVKIKKAAGRVAGTPTVQRTR